MKLLDHKYLVITPCFVYLTIFTSIYVTGTYNLQESQIYPTLIHLSLQE